MKSQNMRNESFSYYICLMIEGSGGGSVPRTNVSGRPKNIRIRISTKHPDIEEVSICRSFDKRVGR